MKKHPDSIDVDDDSKKVKRKPLRKSVVEYIEPDGKKTVTEETFYDDGTSIQKVIVHDGKETQQSSSSTKSISNNDNNDDDNDAKKDVMKLKDQPSKDKSLLSSNKYLHGKPEIVIDSKSSYFTGSDVTAVTDDSTDFDIMLNRKQNNDAPIKKRFPNDMCHLKDSVNKDPPQIFTSTDYFKNKTGGNKVVINQDERKFSSKDYSLDEINDVEDAVNQEPTPIAPRNDFTYNETVEAYTVPDETPLNEVTIHATAVQIEKKQILCFPETIFKTKHGTVKKRCWIFLVIFIIICAIVGIVVSMTSKSSPNTQDISAEVDSTPSQKQSFSPTSQPSVVQYPSMNPTEIGCNFLCLTEIIQCPNDTSSLKLCHVAEVNNLCITVTPCTTKEATHKCGTAFHVYRKLICPIEMPWRQVSNGFEYYVETVKIDWSSHRRRANQYNASLASIHSQGEMSLIMSMIEDTDNTDSYYIGGSRRGIVDDPWTDGTAAFLEWTDNTPWDFTVWDSGEPSGQSMGNDVRESVVVIRGSRMRDTFSSIDHPAIYKRQSEGNYTRILELSQTLGWTHVCALPNNSYLFCWGLNNHGQIGDGSTTKRYTPTVVNLGDGTSVTQVALGLFHTCALLGNAIVKCWGMNNYGQLGDGSIINRFTPTVSNIANGIIVTQLALGGFHSCGLFDSGTVKCWGRNNDGQLGDGSTIDRYNPTAVNFGNDTIDTHLALGGFHSCALLGNDIVKCWGKNEFGQLGDGTTTRRFIPTTVDIDNGRAITQLAVGTYHSCTLVDDGTVTCWGKNDFGQLGDGTTTNRLIPTVINVGNGRAVTQLALGHYHSCALLDNGTVKCWGRNDHGQVGDGSTTNRLIPNAIYVGSGTSVTQLALGLYNTCALLDNGIVKCWGRNNDGQLGGGSNIDSITNASWAEPPLFYTD